MINGAYGAADSTRLELEVNSCNRDPSATVKETASDVQVTVTLSGVDTGADCQDGLVVELRSPLDDRQVIDVATGDVIPVEALEQ